MSFAVDQELYQDFLLEAGEILDQLGTFLVDLEQQPDDNELLNKVFRAFHNIKGGAGFLNLSTLVELCHCAEDVFNTLRQGARHVDADLMDAVLNALDVLNGMFEQLRNGEEPGAAEPALLERLHAHAQPATGAAAVLSPAASVPVAAVAAIAGAASVDAAALADVTDQEFEALLAALKESDAAPPTDAVPAGEINDMEFERLLDELHGAGRHGGVPAEVAGGGGRGAARAASGEISDDEFEKLLDDLHGAGRHLGVPAHAVAPATAPSGAKGEISDDEFEHLLDQLHGPGKRPGAPTPPAPRAHPVPLQASAAPARAEPRPAPPATAPKAATAQAENTVRVDTKRLDDIMNMVGELVLVRNRLVTLEAAQTSEALAEAVNNLSLVTGDLQAAVMKTRMQPVKKVFGRFPRLVRDLARSLNKEVILELQGEDTDLDKNLVEAIADPLVHLVRNAVDHGIEPPAQREAAGKARAGTVLLTAEQEGDHILLTIADDGAGMDPELLRRKAVEKGLLDADAAARLDEADCYNLIFLPGFSTKSEVSDVSGRGVGMDVVRTRFAQLNGAVNIESERGKGTRFLIKVPLTLAIMPTLMVMLGRQIFALPLLSVVEIFDFDATRTNTIDGQTVVLVRGKPLPIFYLARWLAVGGTSGAGHVVVVSVGAQRAGLVVEHLIGQEEVVIKPLGALLRGTPGLAGATITGDGRIALILDVPGLIGAHTRRMGKVA